MAKRKPAPKATYVYTKDESAPVDSPKRGKTGGIKKTKTSNDKPISRNNTVTRLQSAEDIKASNSGEEAKRIGSADFARKQDAELKTSIPLQDRLPVARRSKEDPKRHSNRKTELDAALDESSFRKAEPAARKEGLAPIPADVAAGPANLPSHGTTPGSMPARIDRGDQKGRKVKIKSKTPGARKSGSIGAPDADGATVREMRSPGDIKDVRRRAKERTSGGRRSTVFDPNALSGRSTARDARNKRFAKKMEKRKASGKVKLPGQILASASQAEGAAADAVSAKAGIPVKQVTGRDATNFVHTDESMAQDLARNHFTQHSASDIQSYVKSTGADMLSFHTHVRHAANASKMIEVGPEGDRRQRSAGKVTRWIKNEGTGAYESKSGYEGWHTVNTRGGKGNKENMRVWKKFEAPTGGLSHIEYLSHQIQKHKENSAIEAKESRSLNRTRRRHRATAALVDAMSGGVQTDRTPKGKARIPKGTSGEYVSSKPGEESTIVKTDKPGFTEVKPPRSKRG